MKHPHVFSLNNGVETAFLPKKSPVGHIAVVIKAGSRDELPHQSGLAHFIEHNLFKGTAKRKTYHILSRLDDVGGELNAYTTKEETVIHASFLKRDLSRAMDIVADVLTASTFPTKELEKEKDIIKDEIASYLDNPSESIFDDFEELVFGNSPLGRNILGTPQSVDTLSAEEIREFIGRTYSPENIKISVSGNFTTRRVEETTHKHFGDHPFAQSSWAPSTPEQVLHTRKELPRAQYQDHYMCGWRTPGLHHSNRRALLLLNNILGGPAMNSRLVLNIREKHGIAYNIESYVNLYSDTGVMGIYLGCDPSQTSRAERLVAAELKKLREQPMGGLQLSKAKKQWLGQMALAEDNGLNAAIGAARALLHFGKISTFEEVADKVAGISASEMCSVAQELLPSDQKFELIYSKR